MSDLNMHHYVHDKSVIRLVEEVVMKELAAHPVESPEAPSGVWLCFFL